MVCTYLTYKTFLEQRDKGNTDTVLELLNGLRVKGPMSSFTTLGLEPENNQNWCVGDNVPGFLTGRR